MATSINPLTSPPAINTGVPAVVAEAPPVDKAMFLQLLVAQIQNQNPLKPVDGIEFLSQLATLSSVEQLAGIRQDLAAIHKALTPVAAAPDPAATP